MNFLRRHWLGWNLRKRRDGDSKAIQRLYQLRDPWGLDVPAEHFRFRETCRLIAIAFGDKLTSLLEIGCGEGLQSQYLAPLAEHFVGIDLSHNAVARARNRRIPNAEFHVGGLGSYRRPLGEPFALVTACEVLYYMDDVSVALNHLYELADNIFVTYYAGVYDKMDRYFCSPQFASAVIRADEREWRAVWRKRG